MDERNWKADVLEMVNDKRRENMFPMELKMGLFVSALNCYKRDSVLKPFPNFDEFIGPDGEKNFDELRQIVDDIPDLGQLSDETELSPIHWQLLHWIFTHGSVQLELVKDPFGVINMFQNNNHSCSLANLKPMLIFKVKSRPKQRFAEYKNRYGTIRAFHGSKVHNFHSIIHNGLVNCLNQRDLYGSGTYLSTAITVAITFSPYGYGWSKSVLGNELSCLALCDVVNHPEISSNACSSSVPNNYYVVQNDDFIQLTHLLVYTKTSPYIPRSVQPSGISYRKIAIILIPIICLFLAYILPSTKWFRLMVMRFRGEI